MSKVVNIAVVDDEPAVEYLYQVSFKKQIKSGDVSLFFFPEAVKLLEFLRANRGVVQILILVSDINMPGMSGVTLAEKVREEFPEIDVYLSSAYDPRTYQNKIDGLKLAGYLPKPVDFDLIHKLVDEKREKIPG